MKLVKLRSYIDRMPTRLTKAGWWYVGATALTSAAAYHSASNVLFLALAFMMSALLLNGLISWWNFSKLEFQHLKAPRIRAHESGTIHFDIIDRKKMMRSQGLTAVIEVETRYQTKPERIKSFIHNRFHPSGCSPVSTEWTPSHRGWHTIKLKHIESYFPFGLLLKIFHQKIASETLVWPARKASSTVDPFLAALRSTSANTASMLKTFESVTEISGLRNYLRGDPMHTFHWKKTAQHRRPIVIEQCSVVARHPDLIRFDFHKKHFENEEQLHDFCSQIATWIDLKRQANQWVRIALHNEDEILIHNDSSYFRIMDQLAVIEPQVNKLESRDHSPVPQTISPSHFSKTRRDHD